MGDFIFGKFALGGGGGGGGGWQCNYTNFVDMTTYMLEWCPGAIDRNILTREYPYANTFYSDKETKCW